MKLSPIEKLQSSITRSRVFYWRDEPLAAMAWQMKSEAQWLSVATRISGNQSLCGTVAKGCSVPRQYGGPPARVLSVGHLINDERSATQLLSVQVVRERAALKRFKMQTHRTTSNQRLEGTPPRCALLRSSAAR